MEIARHWRLKAQRYGLVGSICPDCGRKDFPPRQVCLDCQGEKIIQSDFPKGEVYSSEKSVVPLPR
ncbi:MAG: zinc ribbon domain-containing protein [Candidatus Microgenomates bacterium]